MAAAPPRQDASPADVAELGARLSQLERDVRVLTARVERLHEIAEAGGGFAGAGGPSRTLAARSGSHARSAVVSHIGQALIALGVGYLLRALTESALVAPAIGIWVGLGYAVAWLVVSRAAARRGDRLRAGFAGVLAPLLAFPLVSEAALRFDVWGAAGSLVVLAAVTTLAFAAAAVNRQQVIAWVAFLGAAGTAFVLMVSLRAYVAAEIFFVALGIGTLWLGYLREWTAPRWAAALIADVLAVVLVARVLNPNAGESAHAVMGVLLMLMFAYPASFVIRTLLLNRDVVLFEIAQSIALLLLLRGALALSPLIGQAQSFLGWAVLANGLAVSGAAVAFAHRGRSTLNAHFYATVGTVMLMSGGAILLDGVSLALFWTSGACALAALALRPGRATFMAHAAVLALAAASPSQLYAYATRALAGGAAVAEAPPLMAVAVCVLLAGLSCVVLRPLDERTVVLRRAAALFATAAAFWGCAGLVAGSVTALLAHATGPVPASVTATIRTVALSAAAAAAAGMGRLPSLAMAAWLAYPFLLFVALKLVAEDLRTDGPLALFVAFGVYGTALIVSARLGRRTTE